MNPVLASFIPGFAKVSMAMRALGITNDEVAAGDRLVATVLQAPFLRFLPAEMLPGDTSQAIQLATGLSSFTSGVPTWLISALDLPQVRQVIGAEAERHVMASEDKDHLLSVIGKIAKNLMGDVDLDVYPTFASFMADGFLPALTKKLGELKGSTPSTTLHRCRKCSELQVATDLVHFNCRFCAAQYNL